MEYVAVTLHIPSFGWHLDLDIPWEMPLPLFLQEALPHILDRKFTLAEDERKTLARGLLYHRLGNHVVPILTHTLKSAGVYDGAELVLTPRKASWPPYAYYLEREILEEESKEGQPASLRERLRQERFYLALERILVGRHRLEENHVADIDLSPFEHGTTVSRRHALIAFRSGTFYLMDLNSRNGTYLNDRRLPPQQPFPLRPGDHIRFGPHLGFRFHIQEATPRLQREP